MCTKKLLNTCAKFWKIVWSIADLWTSRQIDMTQAQSMHKQLGSDRVKGRQDICKIHKKYSKQGPLLEKCHVV